MEREAGGEGDESHISIKIKLFEILKKKIKFLNLEYFLYICTMHIRTKPEEREKELLDGLNSIISLLDDDCYVHYTNEGKCGVLLDNDFTMLNSVKVRASIRNYLEPLVYMYEGKKARYKSIGRYVLGVGESDMHVDHINGNRLDNRRKNLRLVTRSQNMMNKRVYKEKVSNRFKGVESTKTNVSFSLVLGYDRYRASMTIQNREVLAAAMYDYVSLNTQGEFGVANIPEGIKNLSVYDFIDKYLKDSITKTFRDKSKNH